MTAEPFSKFGVEIEAMLVSGEALDVLPVADLLLRDGDGAIVNSVTRGAITWSNELVAHVLEFKTSVPATAAELPGLGEVFHASMLEANARLRALGPGCLLGTGMHPWFDPLRDGVQLWMHDDREIYETFHRIFDCRGHGWSNLQSFHLNLPFGDDEDFRRLHSAIRLVLPLIPALAASSPFVEGAATGRLDSRLHVYRHNCDRVPAITGLLIPGVIHSEDEYRERVFERIAAGLAPHDSERVLEPEWTNARGAIARFDRGAIEIRVGDAQECPRRDLAVIQAIVHMLRGWFEEETCPLAVQEAAGTELLRSLFDDAVLRGRGAIVADDMLLAAYGKRGPTRLQDVLAGLIPRDPGSAPWVGDVRDIVENGCLAERLLAASRAEPLAAIYEQLAGCMQDNEPFKSAP